MDDAALDADFELLLSTVRDGADIALKFFHGDYEVKKKSGGSPVTDADQAIDNHMRRVLCAARPDYGWLSEETEDTSARLNTQRQWVVDPIDGTKAFIKGLPTFTVCGALVANEAPILAVVINPVAKQVFSARRGGGAQLNGKPMAVSTRSELPGARMAGAKDMFQHPDWPEPWPEMDIDNPNSVAYRLCLVAAGLRDAAVRLNPCHEWDIAAAHLLVTEAGGEVSTHDDCPLVYNKPKPIVGSLIAAGASLRSQILRRTKDLRLPGQKNGRK